MNQYIINNAIIVTPNEVINNGSVIIENGKIVEIFRSPDFNNTRGYERIDAKGNYLIPGIIDIHTDAMDVEICPRSSADFPIEVAFRELEKRMCGCGITTVYHSLHLGYKDAETMLNSKYSRKQIFEEVYAASKKNTLINNKIHLRYEISGIEDYDLCFELVEKGYVSLFSIMDHTPGQGQLSYDKFVKHIQHERGYSKEMAIVEVEKRMKRPRISQAQIEELVVFLQLKGIPIASHDDDTIEKLENNYYMGINICEFPINIETATRATELKMSVVGGASNILRGGSTGGNLDMKEAAKNRLINVLCSDYYSPSLLHSVFLVANEKIMSLPEAINLVSLNAANSVGLGKTKGSIEIGKDADLLLVDYTDHFPTVISAIVNGNISGKYNLVPKEMFEFSN